MIFSFIKGFFMGIIQIIFVILYAVILVIGSGALLVVMHSMLNSDVKYIVYTISNISFLSLIIVLAFWSLFFIIKIRKIILNRKIEKESLRAQKKILMVIVKK